MTFLAHLSYTPLAMMKTKLALFQTYTAILLLIAAKQKIGIAQEIYYRLGCTKF